MHILPRIIQNSCRRSQRTTNTLSKRLFRREVSNSTCPSSTSLTYIYIPFRTNHIPLKYSCYHAPNIPQRQDCRKVIAHLNACSPPTHTRAHVATCAVNPHKLLQAPSHSQNFHVTPRPGKFGASPACFSCLRCKRAVTYTHISLKSTGGERGRRAPIRNVSIYTHKCDA